MSRHREQLEYLVGDEHDYVALLKSRDITELISEAAKQGGIQIALRADSGDLLCCEGEQITGNEVRFPLKFEGEVVATLLLKGGELSLEAAGRVLQLAVTSVIKGRLKRMMTARMHTTVVTSSYDELLAKNQALTLSETRYRELAESLEVKVKERTWELGILHARLLQQEKLASVGVLAAGVAHEINNPIGFINSNLSTLKKYVGRMIDMLDWYQTAGGCVSQDAESQRREELKIDYVKEDIWELLDQSLAGSERIRKIVADLKGFSHLDEVEGESFDLAEEVQRTLAVMKSQIPDDAAVVCELAQIPRVRGSGAHFCQAVINMVQNSILARPHGLLLRLGSRLERGMAVFTITDNGTGVPAELRSRIFEPFFTTRDVGEGQGMGLAVVYDIVKKFGGTISVCDADGGGSCFIIALNCSVATEEVAGV